MQNTSFEKVATSRLISTFMLIVAMIHPVESFAMACSANGVACTDSTPCKTISGVDVCLSTVNPLPTGALQTDQPCWSSTGSYVCTDPSGNINDACGALASDKSCGKTGFEVISTDPMTGMPNAYLDTYQCQTGGGVQYTQTDCSGQTYCSDGTCYTSKDKPNNALAKVVTAVEVGRQAGFYMDPDTKTAFGGKGQWCTKNNLGLANCCKPDNSSKSFGNAMLVNELIKTGWNQWVSHEVGSTYMFDTLFDQADKYLEMAINGMEEVLGTKVTATGVQVTEAPPSTTTPVPGSWAAAGGGMVGGMIGQVIGSTAVEMMGGSVIAQGIGGAVGSTAGTIGGTYIGGGAYAMATGGSFTAGGATAVTGICVPCLTAVLVFMIVMAFLACDIPEIKTQMKLGAGICHYVGSYCSLKSWQGCITTKQNYCCFNSKLAMIIQEQARSTGQLGRTWGTPQNPDCSGISINELMAIDFSKMDLSKFFDEVAAKATPDASKIAASATSRAQQFFANSNTPTASMGVIPSPVAGVPLPVNISTFDPAPAPAMPSCNVAVVKDAPAQDGSQAGVFNITSCLANGVAAFTYVGDCGSIPSQTVTDVPLDNAGAGTYSLTLPAACALKNNTWVARIIEPASGNMPGKVNALW